MNKRQLKLSTFFSKKTKVEKNENQSAQSLNHNMFPEESESHEEAGSSNETALFEVAGSENQETNCYEPKNRHVTLEKYDLGNLLGSELVLTDEEKYNWLKYSWAPPPDFKFPIVPEKNHNRSFQVSWLKSFSWLVYSKSLNGGLCKVCVLFGKGEGGTNDVKLGKLVKEPLIAFKKATEIFRTHACTDYHKSNVVKAHNFLFVMEGKKKDVVSYIQSSERAIVEENKKKLIPIIKTIIFCGMQNIALRGHRDDGELYSKKNSLHQEGNFRALLKFRIDAGDELLASHLNSCKKSSSYISKTIQNDLINCCGEVISSKIITRIKIAKFFTLIADETTDVSTQEQLSICARYYDDEVGEIREDFITFIDVVNVSGENLFNTIMEELKILNLSIQDCRGQAYDGGANMSGKFQGVQARIKKIQPLAVYTHCANHRLNLALGKACSVSSIRNAVGVISCTANFFKESSKRMNMLKEEAKGNIRPEKHCVKKMCETRWIERHDAVITFLDSLPFIQSTLENMSSTDAGKGASAFSLLQGITSSEFIVSLVVLSKIMAVTLPLARRLQAEYLDVIKAMQLVGCTLSCLKEDRLNNEATFDELFQKVEDLASEMGTEIRKPRITKIQNNRNNLLCGSVKDYYRVSIYLPFLDFLINELSTRFPEEEMVTVSKLQCLLPESGIFSNSFKETILEGAKLYTSDLPSFNHLEGELSIWKQMWTSKEVMFPKCPADAYPFSVDLPNIRVLLRLLCTLPVTTSTAERSFSALKRIKSYLRSNMTEDRLNGLAKLHIHRDLASEMSAEDVLDVFGRKHKRKLLLSLDD